MNHFTPHVTEAEIDGGLQRLFMTNSATLLRFIDQVFAAPNCRVQSVTQQQRHFICSGSIDLDVNLSNGERLLVENKIDAGWSVTRSGEWQPDRYRGSVQYLRSIGCKARSVLIAPQMYLSSSKQASKFDVHVSYEAIAPMLTGTDLTLMLRAIKQAETPYEPVPNEQTGDFFSSYAQLVQNEFPALRLKVNPNGAGTRPSGSRTFYFDAKQMLSSYTDIPRPRISVQALDSGAATASAKFMIGGWGLLVGKCPEPSSLSAIGAYMRPAGRSLGLVVDTPFLDTQGPFTQQIEAVREGLSAIGRLSVWWRENGSELAVWFKSAKEAQNEH